MRCAGSGSQQLGRSLAFAAWKGAMMRLPVKETLPAAFSQTGEYPQSTRTLSTIEIATWPGAVASRP
jgi:hypothetical protein